MDREWRDQMAKAFLQGCALGLLLLIALIVWVVIQANRSDGAKADTLPQSHGQLQRLFRACERAQNADQLLAHTPPSWGPLPWTFTGVRTWTDGIERPAERTVTVTVHQVRDIFRNGQHAIDVVYRVRLPVTYDRLHTFQCMKGPGL